MNRDGLIEIGTKALQDQFPDGAWTETENMVAVVLDAIQESTRNFEYERLPDVDSVRAHVRNCEGSHVQQAIYSTFMDTLTQVCFTEQKVRSTIEWKDNRSWIPKAEPVGLGGEHMDYGPQYRD